MHVMFASARRVARPLAASFAASASAAAWYSSTIASSEEAPKPAAPKAGLDPNAWVPLTLSKITKLSHNTAIYRFAYDDPTVTSGMTVASCLLTKAAIGSEKKDGTRANVMRPYTPITRPAVVGCLERAPVRSRTVLRLPRR